ncbi:DUF4174 domain-containing protein [Psychroserpens luteus]|uniref:DUF4174 domain-containing protein n=1 Tax=Psychroserpens luteus TaxID=1434066 RepID=A0ABW5ZRN3_9FLAO|nr:DUF4174 domain-containing protein [Psychroserpens luteus]
MKRNVSITIILILTFNLYMKAQDLSKHQWKNRVLLIITENIEDQEFKNQIKKLQNNQKGLQNRKLIIYQMTPTHFKLGISEENEWIKRPELYNNLKSNDKTFEVILVGLDGGEKLRQNSVLTTDKLFSLIDGMPMRRAEIKNKN